MYTIEAVYNGTANFLGAIDPTQVLTVTGVPATSTAATNSSATFSTSAQMVSLSATVTSSSSTVNEGMETFTILSGMTTIGSSVTVNVMAGAASASYSLPAGTAAGNYTIEAVYNDGNVNYLGSTDSSHTLTINRAATSTAAVNATAPLSSAAQTVSLMASVTSTAGTVSGGTVTFTILQGTTDVGSPTMANVTAGTTGSTSYTLPAGTALGTYTIQAAYNGTADFLGSSDNAHQLIVGNPQGLTTTTAQNVTTAYNSAAQSLSLSASVTSSVTVNEGTLTFTILSGTTTIGSAVTVDVTNGAASTSYMLPAGTAVGLYTIQAVYSDSGPAGFTTSSDTSHTLTVNPAMSLTAAENATATYSASSQTVALSATVTSAAGTVDGGTLTFTIMSGSTVVGTAVPVDVTDGSASVLYALPAGTAAGNYMIETSYGGTTNFFSSSDSAQQLMISPAMSTSVATSATASFNSSTQTVMLSATVTSTAGTVNGGTVTFTVFSGTTVIGTAINASAVAGMASGTYMLPAGTAAGNYTIDASYGSTNNFASSTATAQPLMISQAMTTSVAVSATTIFSGSLQPVLIHVTINSGAGPVNGGIVVITIFGGTIIGTELSLPVDNGLASGTYILPAGTAAGSYMIEASYGGTNNFATSGDTSQQLMVTPAETTSLAVSATATFSASVQTVLLSAAVNSTAGTVNEGMVKFTILSGMTVIGTAISEPVAAGVASGNYTLPAGTVGGTYTIQASYGGATDFATSSDSTQQLNLSPALVTVAASTTTVNFSNLVQTVTLSATVTSTAGTVDEGMVTFTIVNGTGSIGTPVAGQVTNGSVSVTYTLPAGVAFGNYTIEAVYGGTASFKTGTDKSQNLAVDSTGAITTLSAVAASASFGTSSQMVTLSITITSTAGPVNEGTVTFTILSGTTVIGTAVTASVAAGGASAMYPIPAGLAPGMYTIKAVYNGTNNFQISSDSSQKLTISEATTTTVAAAPVPATFSTSGQTVMLVPRW